MAHVLVADKNREVRALVRRVLEDAGFTCDEAASATDALNRLAGRVPDLLLVDLGLPEDGADLLLTRSA